MIVAVRRVKKWMMRIIPIRNYSGMLIGRSIAILYFLTRKITAEGAEERRVFNRLFPLRVPPRTLRLNSRFGYISPHVIGSPCIVKSPDGGFGYLSSYSYSFIYQHRRLSVSSI